MDIVVTKETDEHVLEQLRTDPVILDVGSGSSEGPNISEDMCMNTQVLQFRQPYGVYEPHLQVFELKWDVLRSKHHI